MYAFPGQFGCQTARYGRQTSGVVTVSVAQSASTAGAWGNAVQAVASTAFDVQGIRVTLANGPAASGFRNDLVVDVMVGAAGSERSVAGPLILGGRAAASSYSLPLLIPSGQRISLRTAAGRTGGTVPDFIFDYFGGTNRDVNEVPQRWVPYGVTVDTSPLAAGVALTAGNSSAWGAWTAITASTTYAHSLWFPMIGLGSQSTVTAVNYRTQLAIADTTASATIAANLTGLYEFPIVVCSTSEQMGPYGSASFPLSFGGFGDFIYAPRPAGSAVSARATCTGTAAANVVTVGVLGAIF